MVLPEVGKHQPRICRRDQGRRRPRVIIGFSLSIAGIWKDRVPTRVSFRFQVLWFRNILTRPWNSNLVLEHMRIKIQKCVDSSASVHCDVLRTFQLSSIETVKNCKLTPIRVVPPWKPDRSVPVPIGALVPSKRPTSWRRRLDRIFSITSALS